MVKLVVELKDEVKRKEFIERGLPHSDEEKDFFECLKYISMVREHQYNEAQEWFDSLSSNLRFERNDVRDVFEYAAVLWAQREYANAPISPQQAKMVLRLFDYVGGLDAFHKEEQNPRNRLINYEKKKNIKNRVARIVIRENFWSDGKSRKHELGTRLQSAFNLGGWSTELTSPEELIATQNSIDVVMLDIDWLGAQKSLEIVSALNNNIRTVAVSFDFLSYDDEMVTQLLDVVDVFWCSSQSVYQQKKLRELSRWSDFPIPLGIERKDELEILSRRAYAYPQPAFVGSIERNNLPRIVYYMSCVAKGQCRFDVSSHLKDNLSPYDSYIEYLNRLAADKVNINFSRRYSGLPQITGRITEVIATKGLLLQEECPQITSWFIEGEHFLSFNGPKSLFDVVESIDYIDTDKIINAAFDFYSEKYSEKQLVEHMEFLLD